MDLTAYAIPGMPPFPLEPADLKRDWSDRHKSLSAAKHPAMARANQAGWVVRCPLDMKWTWNGDPKPYKGLIFYSYDKRRELYSRFFTEPFGHGIVTISLPFVFRTPPGYGLWVRGPSNFWAANMQPLDGLVESDWLQGTFTMNWRILEPNQTCGFSAGDPICMLVPFPLDLLETVEPKRLVTPTTPAPAGPVVAPDGSWQHILAADASAAPGKVRLRLKRFEDQR